MKFRTYKKPSIIKIGKIYIARYTHEETSRLDFLGRTFKIKTLRKKTVNILNDAFSCSIRGQEGIWTFYIKDFLNEVSES